MKIGKVSKQQENMRGWLVGQFFPEDSGFKDENVEIYFKTFMVGNPNDKFHKHPNSKEYVIVLSGKAKMRVDEEVFEISKGDYFMIPGDLPDKLIEIFEELTIVGVRYPSIPNNKIVLEK